MGSTAAAAVPCGRVGFLGTATPHPSTVLTSTVSQPQHAYDAPQGMCFSLPSPSPADYSNDTCSAGGSSCQHSPYTSVQSFGLGPLHPAGQQANSRSAGLLCHSPCISTGPDPCLHSTMLPSPSQYTSHPVSKRHCQHVQDSDRAGSGMQHHQLDVSCKHGFALPSLHSMLGSGAAASKLPGGATAAAVTAAVPGGRPSTAVMAMQDITKQDCPAGACNSEQQPERCQGSLWSNGWSPTATKSHARPPSPVTGAGYSAAAESAQSLSQLAQAFMQACASPGAVAALAVLNHNSLLPVLPVEDQSPSDSDDAPDGCMRATLGYMFVLARTGNVMGMLTDGSADPDTIIRTLLWMTQSFFSQYRSHCKTAAYDYCMYTSGLEMDDPMVQDALGHEVPAMIALQRHILASSGFRLMVTEQLQYACSILQEASTDSCSIQSIQSKVDLVVVEYEEWRLAALDALHAQQRQQQQGTQPKPEQELGQPPKQQQQRGVLQDVSNVKPAGNRQSLLAAVTAANAHAGVPAGPAPHPTTCAPLSNAPKPHPQQQQQGPQTRQQYRVAGSRQSAQTSTCENTAPGDPAANQDGVNVQCARPAASKKDQLLQLTSKEQAVGSKRRRSAAGTAAAGGPARPLQQQQQQGREGGFGAGGKRLLRRAMRAAQSAAQYLGCRPQ